MISNKLKLIILLFFSVIVSSCTSEDGKLTILYTVSNFEEEDWDIKYNADIEYMNDKGQMILMEDQELPWSEIIHVYKPYRAVVKVSYKMKDGVAVPETGPYVYGNTASITSDQGVVINLKPEKTDSKAEFEEWLQENTYTVEHVYN